jgi:hypothetical protein
MKNPRNTVIGPYLPSNQRYASLAAVKWVKNNILATDDEVNAASDDFKAQWGHNPASAFYVTACAELQCNSRKLGLA